MQAPDPADPAATPPVPDHAVWPTSRPGRAFAGWVVAIGASAGGLDALERLFGALPCDTGAAFVVIQHLSPDHKSMMDNLLARYTRMPVQVAAHDQALAADTVYLIPPGKTMRLAGQRLQLDPKPAHGLSLPIDIFFASLADEARERAIGVVLSGTGSDGSRGVGAINAQGGFVFAQDPASAKFDGMPRAAIATGLVDQVAAPADLAALIVGQIGAPRAPTPAAAPAAAPPAGATPLERILQRLLNASGIDFRDYKPATVARRIERRMQVLHTASLEDYEQRLAASPDEAALLRRELLIPVTRLFRDPEAFEALASRVVDPLASGFSGAEPIRVWIAGCSTGEEAYTIALLFADAFRRLGRRHPLKIFATDVEAQYVDSAASGFFPVNAAAEVPPALLDAGFVQVDGGFQARPEIRQTVIFARHNLLADPPFTRMDLVCCRNVLIYFDAAAQERALERLRYALVPGGTLMLGPSESLGAMHRDFATIDSRHKLYRLAHRGRLALGLAAAMPARSPMTRGGEPRTAGATPERPADVALRQLVQAYVPPTLVLGERRELLHVVGDPRGWLQMREGEPSLDVLKLLPQELSWAAALLLQSVRQAPGEHRSPALRVDLDGGGQRQVQLVARPLGEPAGDGAPFVMLSVETAPAGRRALDDAQVALGIDQQERLQALEQELNRTYDSLRATIEELETANEELQATNEELMASNEELQSTNEELQSVNEELYTVNSEYQEKVDILNSLNADLDNVSKASAIPTLFVDDALTLVRFTPEAAQLFKVREGDIGRSIEDFTHTLDYPELFADARRTIDSGRAGEREVASRDGRWWLARIQPYADRAHSRPRAVMTFIDITSIKDFQRLQAIVDSLGDHLAVVDGQGRITMVNQSWRRFAIDNGDSRMLGCGPGVNYLEVCAGAALHDDDARRAYDGLAAVLAGQQPSFSMRYPCHSPTVHRWFQMQVTPVGHPGGGAVVAHRDITAWLEPVAEAAP